MANVINRSDLPDGGDFQGYLFGDVGVSFIWVESASPGEGPRLHKHDYEEVFVVIEGRAVYTLGEETVEVSGGQIVIAPAGVPHKFVMPAPECSGRSTSTPATASPPTGLKSNGNA